MKLSDVKVPRSGDWLVKSGRDWLEGLHGGADIFDVDIGLDASKDTRGCGAFTLDSGNNVLSLFKEFLENFILKLFVLILDGVLHFL